MQIIFKRALLGALGLILALSLVAAAVIAASTADLVKVADVDSVIYADNGITFVEKEKSFDVFVDATTDVRYYILFAGYIDVFHSGVSSKPAGSYFKPPFENGAWVATIGDNVSIAPKTELTNENNWKISVPSLKPGEIYELRIAAIKTGADEIIYGHRFIGSGIEFRAEIDGGNLISTVVNHTKEASAVDAKILVAIYKDNTLTHLETSSFEVDANSETSTSVMDIKEYQNGEHTFKAFCWDSNYIPLVDAIELNKTNIND